MVDTGWRHEANQSHVPPQDTSLGEVWRNKSPQLDRETEDERSWTPVRRKETQTSTVGDKYLPHSHFFFLTRRVLLSCGALWVRHEKNSARVLKALFAFCSRLKVCSEFSGCEKRTDGLTQSRRNVSNLGSGESASVEMSRLCALDRPAPPKRPGPERLWWVPILPLRQTFASFPCLSLLALVTLRLSSAM